MEIIQFMYANLGKTVLILSWVCCAIASISLKDRSCMGIPLVLTVLYGIFLFIKHNNGW